MEIILYVARQIQGMKQFVLIMSPLEMNLSILTDMFCAADPKEAITFLEKTKEKVSPRSPKKFLVEGLCRCGELSCLLNHKIEPRRVFFVCLFVY